MRNRTIKVGIAGCGWIAESAYMPALNKITHAKVVSLFDVDKIRMSSLAYKFKVKQEYTSYDRFLESGIEAVIICTPNYTHADFSTRALLAGKHVLCEKPITMNTAELKNVLKASKKNNNIYIPGFVNRFRRDIKKLREMALDKEIGNITYVEACWIRKSGIPRPGTWFTNKEFSGGGVLIDLGSHLIDICLMLLPHKTTQSIKLLTKENFIAKPNVSASWFEVKQKNNMAFDVEDTAIAELEFKESTRMKVTLSWTAPVKGDYTCISIHGEKGCIELKTLFGFSNDRLWNQDEFILKRFDSDQTLNISVGNHSISNAFESMLKYFINVINRKCSDMYLNASDGYRCVQVIESLYRHKEINDLLLADLSMGSENIG